MRRRYAKFASAQLVVGLLTACGSGDADASKSAVPTETGAMPEVFDASAKEPLAQTATKLSETDRMMLTKAATACKSGDYKSLFDAFIQSAMVRQKYSAPSIDSVLRSTDGGDVLDKKKILAANYTDFPLKMVDYYRKPVKPVKAGDDEYVELVFNQSQDNRIVIEWARVTYQGPGEGGDDLGQPVDLDGEAYDAAGFKDGQLLFYPTQDCWQLVADTRYQRL
jgi:hypothetical protein